MSPVYIPTDPSATTLMAAVATATSAIPRLYPLNGVPASPTYPYGVYSAQLTRGDAYTLEATHGVRWLRVTFQAFGRTVDSTLDVTERFIAALADQPLTATGLVTTPLRIELDPTPPTRDPDTAGVVGVTTTLTATAEEA